MSMEKVDTNTHLSQPSIDAGRAIFLVEMYTHRPATNQTLTLSSYTVLSLSLLTSKIREQVIRIL
jgi:hypothetical protein